MLSNEAYGEFFSTCLSQQDDNNFLVAQEQRQVKKEMAEKFTDALLEDMGSEREVTELFVEHCLMFQ